MHSTNLLHWQATCQSYSHEAQLDNPAHGNETKKGWLEKELVAAVKGKWRWVGAEATGEEKMKAQLRIRAHNDEHGILSA